MTHDMKSLHPPVVLLVEDDELTRAVAAGAFDDAGFVVLEAADAAEALSILGVSGSKVQALFTDIEMPGGMNGMFLALRVRQRWPWIRLAATSGRVRPSAAAMPHRARFFPKPYEIERVVGHFRDACRAA
jgi:CheY-like chemotaxis protein